MIPTHELLSYVKLSLEQGDARELIEAELRKRGWAVDEINQSFEQVNAGAVKKITLIAPSKPRDHKGQLITTIAGLGALLVGLGVILMIASNWQDIGRWVKVALVFGMLLLTYSASYYFIYFKDFPRLGRSLAFLATLLFGGAIVLIAQIFNIVAENNDTLLYWALLILPVIYGFELKSSLALSVVLVFVWQIIKSAGGTNMLGFIDFGSQSVNYLYLFIVGLILMPLTYKIKANKVQLLNLLGIGFWLLMACAIWASENTSSEKSISSFLLGVSFIYGASIFLIGRVHANWPQFELMEKSFTSVAFFSIFVPSFILSFDEMSRGFANLTKSGASAISWQSGVALFALVSAAVFAIFYLKTNNENRKLFMVGNIASGLIFVLALSLIFFPSNLYLIIFNLLVFVESLALMWLGYETRDSGYINLGLSVFALMVLVKYFQWGYELFDRSLFFIGGGLVLIGVSYFGERQRRRLIQKMSQNNV